MTGFVGALKEQGFTHREKRQSTGPLALVPQGDPLATGNRWYHCITLYEALYEKCVCKCNTHFTSPETRRARVISLLVNEVSPSPLACTSKISYA